MQEAKRNPLKERIHEVIFEADTPAGKVFDVGLFILILLSVLVVFLESIGPIHDRYFRLFYTLEWIFTGVFTIEYLLRLYVVYKPRKYALSFFGIVDLLAILPTYISLFFVGTQSLIVIRALRLLRVFRVFKAAKFVRESRIILIAMRQSLRKILVFMLFVLLLVVIFGSVMYLVEGGYNPQFDSIPRSVYWAIVTLTTVGYGDIAPTTNLGQFLASVVMILGYAVIAVPTGIVSSEFIKTERRSSTQACLACGNDGHDVDAKHCKYCGEDLHPKPV